MKNITSFILESYDAKYQDILTKTQHSIIDMFQKKYGNNNIKSFFSGLKKFRGAAQQSPMRQNSIFACFGNEGDNTEEYLGFQKYDNIFIKSSDKYAVFFDQNNSQIAIANKINISYSGNGKDTGCFLQDDGSYSGKSSSIIWLDINSDVVADELVKIVK